MAKTSSDKADQTPDQDSDQIQTETLKSEKIQTISRKIQTIQTLKALCLNLVWICWKFVCIQISWSEFRFDFGLKLA